MRKTLVVLTVGLLAVLLLVTPGLAGGGNGPGHGKPPVFALQGCISSLDPTLAVSVVKSMKGADLPKPGETATIYTNGDTVFYKYAEDEFGAIVRTEIAFEDLEIDDPVSVTGDIEEDGLWATQVTVNPYCEVLLGECGDD